jgi:hypothetical protein
VDEWADGQMGQWVTNLGERHGFGAQKTCHGAGLGWRWESSGVI